MSAEWLWLVAAGAGAGLMGSVAGLASLFSYPALLAAGLPPVAANVTNTVALFGVTGGTIAGSRPELRGQGRRLRRLIAVSVAGGSAGAALLLLTPAEAFERVVPWLIAGGSLLLLLRDRLRIWSSGSSARVRGGPGIGRALTWGAVVFLVGVYGGYFGAGVGIIALAALSVERFEPLPITNAVKNVATGSANAAAAIAYMLFGPLDWSAAAAVGLGAVFGGFLGPRIVRIVPEKPLRWSVATAGLLLALHLAIG